MALANFLVIFVQNIFVKKKNWAKKSLFWQFLKYTIFSQKSDYLNRIPCGIPFLEMYTFIYFTLLVFKL